MNKVSSIMVKTTQTDAAIGDIVRILDAVRISLLVLVVNSSLGMGTNPGKQANLLILHAVFESTSWQVLLTKNIRHLKSMVLT